MSNKTNTVSQLVVLSDGFEMKTLTDNQELIDKALLVLADIQNNCNYKHKAHSIVYALVIAYDERLTKYAAMSKEQAQQFIEEHEYVTHAATQCDIAQTQSVENIALIRSVFMNPHDDDDYFERLKIFKRKEREKRTAKKREQAYKDIMSNDTV